MIYILAGDIRTGKTSALMDWIPTWDNVKGILCPDGEEDLRLLYNIETGDALPLEAAEQSANTISVGKFHFHKAAFEVANIILKKSFAEAEFEFLVLDELGRLELKGQGIHPAASHIIKNYQSNDDSHLLLVIRTSLVKDIIAHYGITNFKVVAQESLP